MAIAPILFIGILFFENLGYFRDIHYVEILVWRPAVNAAPVQIAVLGLLLPVELFADEYEVGFVKIGDISFVNGSKTGFFDFVLVTA